MAEILNFETLEQAVAGEAVAIRARTRLQPAGGPGDKLFPPTYADDKSRYAIEQRRRDGVETAAVLLDSVASQANRFEEALLSAWEEENLSFPLIQVDFASADPELADIGTLSTLQVPHRIADAILRDSQNGEGVPFRETTAGRAFIAARPSRATALYRLCPTALVFGVWDSTGAAGGSGTKFQRALVSEIVGYGAIPGAKTASRIDPLGISRDVPIFELASAPADWTLDEAEATKEKGKPKPFARKGEKQPGRPATLNHGNIAPSIDRTAGGVTIDYAEQVSVLSLAALRKLRFPEDYDGNVLDPAQRPAAETAARTALAALALTALSCAREQGYDLRSRCLLVPDPPGPLTFELVSGDGTLLGVYTLRRANALALLHSAAERAAGYGFDWERSPLRLTPAPNLAELVRRSRNKPATSDDEGA